MTPEQRIATMRSLVTEIRSAVANALEAVDDAGGAAEPNGIAGSLMVAEIELRAALKLVEAAMTIHRTRATP